MRSALCRAHLGSENILPTRSRIIPCLNFFNGGFTNLGGKQIPPPRWTRQSAERIFEVKYFYLEHHRKQVGYAESLWTWARQSAELMFRVVYSRAPRKKSYSEHKLGRAPSWCSESRSQHELGRAPSWCSEWFTPEPPRRKLFWAVLQYVQRSVHDSTPTRTWK